MSKIAREVIHDAIMKASKTISPSMFARGGQGAEFLIEELAAAGFVIVPKEPSEAMLAAGTAADWVGEVESRAGRSITPDVHHDYETGRDVERPGIWRAMIEAAQ